MQRLPKQLLYKILNKLSDKDLHNYVLINSNTANLRGDEEFFKVRVLVHDFKLFENKPRATTWVNWYKKFVKSGQLICNEQT